MYLPKNIRYLRKKNNLSQDDLAEKLGYKSYTTIQKWESGVSEPPFKALRMMADLFDCDVDDMANVNLESDSSASNDSTPYYLNEESAKVAQKYFDQPEYRVLFDAADGVKPENIMLAAEMLKRFKETNSDG